MTAVAIGGPNAVTPRASAIAPMDFLIGALVLCMVLSIVQVPPIPISPYIYLAPLALVLADASMLAARHTVMESRPLRWLTVLFALKVVMLCAIQPLAYALVAESARTVCAWMAVLAAALYAASLPQRFRRLALFLVLSTAASAFWFLLELGVGEPFPTLRQQLYFDIYGAIQAEIVDTIRSGLTPFRHQLGYQFGALLPLAAGFLLMAKRKSWIVLCAAFLVAGMLALMASLQRSSLAAVGLAGLIFLITGKRARSIVLVGLVVVAGAGITAVVILNEQPELAVLAQDNLFDKLQNQEQQLDSDFRMALQGRALELLIQYPLGLPEAKVEWVDVGFWHTYYRMHEVPGFYDIPFAVHNGYLSESLRFGLAFFVITVLMVLSTFIAIARVALHWQTLPPDIGLLALSTACACAGMFSFQTLTHNASVVTLEPSSLFLFSLLVAAQSGVIAAVRATAPGDEIHSSAAV